MLILSIPRMIVSSDKGWHELTQDSSSLGTLFWRLVLPLSLIPPVMLYLYGPDHGDLLIQGYSSKPWHIIAPVFFAAEMFTWLLMGWLIRQVTESQWIEATPKDAFRLASIAPVPLWLSALGLFVPNMTVNVVLGLLAMVATGSLIHHGVRAVLKVQDELVAASITHTVMGAGIAGWSFLLLLIAWI